MVQFRKKIWGKFFLKNWGFIIILLTLLKKGYIMVSFFKKLDVKKSGYHDFTINDIRFENCYIKNIDDYYYHLIDRDLKYFFENSRYACIDMGFYDYNIFDELPKDINNPCLSLCIFCLNDENIKLPENWNIYELDFYNSYMTPEIPDSFKTFKIDYTEEQLNYFLYGEDFDYFETFNF
jgi:hypothetical protein